MHCFPLLLLYLASPILASPPVWGGSGGWSGGQSLFYKGHDLSSLRIFEESGVVFKDTQRGNVTRPADEILASGGMNTVRLRLWVDPTSGDQYGTHAGDYGLNYTLSLAKEMRAKGYQIYLDFHFSNYWADPSKQAIPSTWPTALAPLSQTLRGYVSDILLTFHRAGVDLAIVSLGNEIRHGMLWPTGYVDVDTQPANARAANYTSLATLWSSARAGVTDATRAGVPKPQVMIHIDDGWNVTLQQAWFGALTATGIVKTSDWDIFGFSFYPFYGTAATLPALSNTLITLAEQYNKPMHVAETDWPAICSAVAAGTLELSDESIPISPAGQTEWVDDIIDVVQNVPRGLGQGIHCKFLCENDQC